MGLFHHHGRRGYPQQSLSAPGAVRNPAAAGRSFSGRFGQGRSRTPQAQCRRQSDADGEVVNVILEIANEIARNYEKSSFGFADNGFSGSGLGRRLRLRLRQGHRHGGEVRNHSGGQCLHSDGSTSHPFGNLLAAQNIIGTIKTESATIVRALVALKESNAATLKGQAVAGEAMKTEDMYGKAAQPAGLCGSSSLGAGIQLGAQAGQEIHAAMREKQLEHAHTPKKPVDFLQRVLADEQLRNRKSGRALSAAKYVDRGSGGAGP